MPRRDGHATPISQQERLDFIEGMRGLAALYVVLSHFVTMVDPGVSIGKSRSPQWLQIAMAPFQYGHLAVAAFIVISGFCLQMALFNGKDGRIHDLKRFYKRRALRILPPYYAALGLSIIVAVTVTASQTVLPFTQYLPVTWENVTAHLLMVHNFSPEWMYKINGVLWSIAIEAQLYIAFPLLVALMFRFGRAFLVGGSTLLAVACLFLFPDAVKLYPWFLPLFCLGMASAHLAYKPSLRFGTSPSVAVAVIGFGFAALLWTSLFNTINPVREGLIGVVVAAVMYLGAVAPWSWLPGTFGRHVVAGLGGFSYSLYLMHHPVQQVLYVYRPGFVQGAVGETLYLLLIGLPVILGATYVFSLAFERPFMNLKPERKRSPKVFAPCSLPLKTVAGSCRGKAPSRAVTTQAERETAGTTVL